MVDDKKPPRRTFEEFMQIVHLVDLMMSLNETENDQQTPLTPQGAGVEYNTLPS